MLSSDEAGDEMFHKRFPHLGLVDSESEEEPQNSEERDFEPESDSEEYQAPMHVVKGEVAYACSSKQCIAVSLKHAYAA